jgi:TldD protein
MRERIEAALQAAQAEYTEIHIEEGERTCLRYRGRELEEIGRTTQRGGNVRALIRGGWGFVSFNDLDQLESSVELAVRQARLVGQEASHLARVEPMVDRVPSVFVNDPREVPLAEKQRLLNHYNDLLWNNAPHIQTTQVRYADSFRQLTFANSDGSYIEQEKADLVARFIAFTRKDDDVQQAFLSLGSADDYGFIHGLDDQIVEVARRAEALLTAPQVKGGTYTVIADPGLAGLFAHEAFGHLSEADFVYENQRLRELLMLGKRFGGEHLNIVDGAGVPDLRGSYRYDDEGTPASKTYLIRGGVLVGRLHSRETSGKMGELVTGNARAISHRFPPIVRMTNTYIEPGEASFEEMIGDIKEGIYAKQSSGGETAMEMFTFSAAEAYMIRNGEVAEMVRGVNLSGNVFETLANIEAVGADLKMRQGGGCGKDEQSPLPVSLGSPHIRIRNVVIGGD